MDIDPRLRDASHTDPGAYAKGPISSAAYTLNPIRLPFPQLSGHGLLPRVDEPGHPYYAIQHEHTPIPLLPPLPLTQSHEEPPFTTARYHNGSRRNHQKRPRACEACRGLKVRCVLDPGKPVCRRCAKAGRHCIVTQPSRKRQKKTDSRVAELEKKIDALTASLYATKNRALDESTGESSDEEDAEQNSPLDTDTKEACSHSANQGSESKGQDYDHAAPTAESNRKRKYPEDRESVESKVDSLSRPVDDVHGIWLAPGDARAQDNKRRGSIPKTERRASQTIPPGLAPPGHEYADIIDRRLIDTETATTMFSRYINDMAPHMPAVVFPSKSSAGEIRKTKPILFLAILSVASGRDDPKLQVTLLKELGRMYADHIICRGDKSLELVQALQISTIWYSPEAYKDAKPYQFINMASTMAISLGLSQKKEFFTSLVLNGWKKGQELRRPLIDTGTVESRRAWLSCYLLCGITSIGFNQLNVIRWSNYLQDCVNVLENSAQSLPSDKVLCQWAQLQRLKDEIMLRFELNDPYAIPHQQNQSKENDLSNFHQKLGLLESQIPEAIMSLPLLLAFRVSNLHLHQIDVRCESPGDTLEVSSGLAEDSIAERPDTKQDTPVQQTNEIEADEKCLDSVHKVLDSALLFTVEDVHNTPTFQFARIALGVICLIRLYRTAIKPESASETRIPLESIKVDFYMDQIVQLMQRAAAEGKCAPAQGFQWALSMVKTWIKRYNSDPGPATRDQTRGLWPKLEAQPVDSGRNTPSSGYRKLSIHDERKSGHTTPRSISIARKTSVASSKFSTLTSPEAVSPLSTQQQYKEKERLQPPQQAYGPQYHNSFSLPPQPPPNNTPSHLLSQSITTSIPSASMPQSSSNNGNNVGWYHDGYQPYSLPQHNDPRNLSFPTDFQNNYYQTPARYGDPALTYNVDPSYQAAAIDMGLEYAIGLNFGEGVDLCNMFIGDGAFGTTSASWMGPSNGWPSGGG